MIARGGRLLVLALVFAAGFLVPAGLLALVTGGSLALVTPAGAGSLGTFERLYDTGVLVVGVLLIGLVAARLVEAFLVSEVKRGRLEALPPWPALVPPLVAGALGLALCTAAVRAVPLLATDVEEAGTAGFVVKVLVKALLAAALFAGGLLAGVEVTRRLARRSAVADRRQ